MNIEKLDTLLRNKLQGLESGVHENELGAILAGVGTPKKSRKAFYIWTIATVLSVSGLAAYHFRMVALATKQAPATASEHIAQTPAGTAIHESSESIMSGNRLSTIPQKPVNTHPKESFRHNLDFNTQIMKLLAAGRGLPWLPEGFDKDRETGLDEEVTGTGLHMRSIQVKPPVYERIPVEPIKPGKSGKKRSFLGSFLTLARPELSGWISPVASFETFSLAGGTDSKVHMDYEASRKGKEKPLLAMSSGLKIQFNILSFLQIGTGLGYFQTGNSYNYQYEINRIPVIDSATQRIIAYITRPGKRVDVSGRHVLSYAEIPLSLKLNLFTSSRITVGIEPAYALQILLSSKGQYIDPVSLELNNNSGYKTRGGNFQLGIPVRYNISKRSSFSAMPYYGYALQSVTDSPYETIQRKYAGIKFSLNYKLYNPLK